MARGPGSSGPGGFSSSRSERGAASDGAGGGTRVPPPRPLIVGIDPGLAATGYAMLMPDGRVTGCGTIRTPPGPPGPRLSALAGEMRRLIFGLSAEAALEELFLGRNTTSAIGVAQARGVVLLVLEEAGIPVSEYKPSQVKSVLTGYGSAPKEQMARVLAAQGGLPPRIDDHAVDAIAIAICHSRSRRLRAAASAAR